jgi:hydroxymethylglutaryl-CoA lyase
MDSFRNNQPDHVTSRAQIIEVGLRDGLQKEPRLVSTEFKTALIDTLAKAGLSRFQVTSFVHPKLVPQMADAEEVCIRLQKKRGIIYSGLVLNMKGLERAHNAGLTHVDISVSASDTHSRRNTRRSLSEALEQFTVMVAQAREYGMTIRGGIQCAFGCVYEGKIDPHRVIGMVEHLLALGIDELSLADSTGMANPSQVRMIIREVQPMVEHKPIILHLHDTYGMGMANVLAALECGVTHFDTALGGLGGCPFIEGAAGNIATEETVHMLSEMGIETGINISEVARCSSFLEQTLGKTLPGKLYRLVRPDKGGEDVRTDSC